MAWLDYKQFEIIETLKRECGISGTGAMLCAAIATEALTDGTRRIAAQWPVDLFSAFEKDTGLSIANEYFGLPTVLFLSAAALKFDLDFQRRLEVICPGLNAELNVRWNSPYGLLPGERIVDLDGLIKECVELTAEDGHKYRRLVEVKND